MKKKTVRKPRANAAPKTRNNGTLTESAFWSFIRSGLRQKSRWWKPITQCKLNAKRAYKGLNKRQKFEYQCNSCNKWFQEKHVAVDHIIPCGSLNCSADLPGFVDRLFVEVDLLQLLCTTCHDAKTKTEKDVRKNEPNSN